MTTAPPAQGTCAGCQQTVTLETDVLHFTGRVSYADLDRQDVDEPGRSCDHTDSEVHELVDALAESVRTARSFRPAEPPTVYEVVCAAVADYVSAVRAMSPNQVDAHSALLNLMIANGLHMTLAVQA